MMFRTMKQLALQLAIAGIVVMSVPAFALEGNENNNESSPAVVQLHVYPTEAKLTSAVDRQSFVVQAQLENGLTVDVTDQATFQIENEAIVKKQNQYIVPTGDGQTNVQITWGEHTATVPAAVVNAASHPPVSFKLDVMPLFMKAGCNTGSCHGAARGKDGFRLSLFGFDPEGDYSRLTREFAGRRIDLAIPEDCLLIQKSIGGVSHSGGERFNAESEYYQTMLRWIKDGAANDPGPVPKVVKLDVYPAGAVLNGEGAQQKLSVRATYEDGTDRDVTSLAYFSSSNDNSAGVDQSGLVTAANRGEAFVMARFDTHTVGVPFIVLPKDLEFQWNDIPENNYIDTLVNNKLKNLRIQPSELCTDFEFIRRASLDICGTLPTAEETTAFVNDADPEKRKKLIDQLLERKEFVEIWVMKWSELLQIRSTQQVSYKATLLYYNWLQEQIANNVPINEMIVSLLSSEGGTFTNAATNYYQNEQNTLLITENVAQVFMGMRIQCAQCHNHPFDRWTMDDYYGFAAFFTQIGRKPSGSDPRETVVFNRRGGEMQHPVSKQNMTPKFLGGDVPDLAGRDRRAVMAEWLTSTENPYFAPNLANIVWAHFFGRGIVDEVDDVRISNPPSNPELLQELGNKFTEYNYDFKSLVRDICNSRTYQLSTQTNHTNESDLTNFSHAAIRRIRAEILLDVISQVTGTENKFRGLPSGARAVQIADGNTSNYFLTTFGRARRETVCSCEVRMDPSLSQALHLINGDTVENKIRSGGVIKQQIDAGKTPQEVLTDLYLRCFNRPPTEAELGPLLAHVNETENKVQALEDVFWALLNAQEFVFNH